MKRQAELARRGYRNHSTGSRLAVAFFIALASLGSCMEAPVPASKSGSKSLSGGEAPLSALGGLLRVDSDWLLTEVGDVLFSSGGERLYVAQPMERLVRVIEVADGSVSFVGGAGSGPGEFQDIFGLSLVGESLAVSDRVLGRVSFFSGAGDLTGTWIWPSGQFEGSYGLRVFFTAPTVVLSIERGLVWGDLAMVPGPSRGSGSIRQPLLLVARDGKQPLEILSRELGGLTFVTSRESAAHTLTTSFVSSQYQALYPEGSGALGVDWEPAGADRQLVRLARIDAEGDTVRVVAWEAAASEIPNAVLRCVVEQADVRSASGSPPSTENWLEVLGRSGRLPAHLPPVSDLRATQDGLAWVRLEEGCDVVRWIAIDEGGDVRHAIDLPPSSSLVASLDHLVAILEAGPLGVQHLIIHELRREAGER